MTCKSQAAWAKKHKHTHAHIITRTHTITHTHTITQHTLAVQLLKVDLVTVPSSMYTAPATQIQSEMHSILRSPLLSGTLTNTNTPHTAKQPGRPRHVAPEQVEVAAASGRDKAADSGRSRVERNRVHHSYARIDRGDRCNMRAEIECARVIISIQTPRIGSAKAARSIPPP